MSNPYSRPIRLLALVNTKYQIRQNEKKYKNINYNNNNFYNNNNNNNLIISSAIIYSGTNDKNMFKIESLKVSCPFTHTHYEKNIGNNDKFLKYNTLQ